MQINDRLNYEEWIDIYKKLVYWEIELSQSDDSAMDEILAMQKEDANKAFFKFIKDNYLTWFNQEIGERPLLSPEVFKHKVFSLFSMVGKKYLFWLSIIFVSISGEQLIRFLITISVSSRKSCITVFYLPQPCMREMPCLQV